MCSKGSQNQRTDLSICRAPNHATAWIAYLSQQSITIAKMPFETIDNTVSPSSNQLRITAYPTPATTLKTAVAPNPQTIEAFASSGRPQRPKSAYASQPTQTEA
mmetsp:Transcript_76437/g.205805  ORF Transcript_76437/g.205805 Transcript_76437/m.205805 type:complete len:104 (+) Transcript_76437:1200-1511(+)